MKKTVIGIGTFLITLVVVLIGAAQTLPSKYEIIATEVIEAPISAVYSKIGDLREWEKWSPWKQDDSSMVFKFSEKAQTAAPGEWISWESNQGPGTMRITEASENSSVKYDLEIEGMSTSTGAVTLGTADEKTVVQWTMKGERTFVEKIFWRYLGIEEEIQEKMIAGVANIRGLAEKK